MNTTSEAKKTAAIILKGCGIGYDRLTAKTVSFSDLARDSCVFVTIHGYRTGPSGGALGLAKATAKQHGFCLDI